MIYYSLLLINETVEGESCATNFKNKKTYRELIVDRIYPTIPKNDHKRTIESDKFNIHYQRKGNMTLFCVEKDSKMRVVWSFMTNIHDQVIRVTLTSSNINRILQHELSFWNDPKSDLLPQVNEKVEELKDIMIENIDKVIQRGEELQEIDKLGEQLEEDSKQFQKKSKRLKRKTLAILICLILFLLLFCFIIVVVIVIIVVFIACGFPSFHRCSGVQAGSSTTK
eukprot:gene3663-6478_t